MSLSPSFFSFFFLFRKYTLKSLVVVGHYLLSIVQEKSSLYCTIPATFLLNCFKIKSIDTKKGKTWNQRKWNYFRLWVQKGILWRKRYLNGSLKDVRIQLSKDEGKIILGRGHMCVVWTCCISCSATHTHIHTQTQTHSHCLGSVLSFLPQTITTAS